MNRISPASSMPETVRQMGDIPISGNIVPMTWFKTLTFDNGKPDTNSILILSDLVYWYRPTEVRDERTGAIIGYKKKFSADMLKRSYTDLESQFGISKKQCQESLRRLENKQIITRIFRTLETPSGRQNNVMYIQLHPEKLKSYTQPNYKDPCSETNSDPMEKKNTPSGNEIPQVWNSTSIGMETKLHSYGDRSPDHIKDTNTTPEITSNITLSHNLAASSSTFDEREVSLKMISIWNELIPQKAILNLSNHLNNQLEAIYNSQLGCSLDQWKLICENFKSSKFLMGEAEGVRIKPDLLWLLDSRKDHLYNVLNKTKYTFDDRVKNNKAITTQDLKSSILSSKDEAELKDIKLDMLQASPRCYLGYYKNAKFKLDETKLKIQVSTGFEKEKIMENSFNQIRALVLNKYNRLFELVVEPKQT